MCRVYAAAEAESFIEAQELKAVGVWLGSRFRCLTCALAAVAQLRLVDAESAQVRLKYFQRAVDFIVAGIPASSSCLFSTATWH